MFAAYRPSFRIAFLGIALGLSPLGQGMAAAQDFGRGPADGQQSGQDPNRRRGSRTEAFLQSLDLNHNGVIEANEVNPQQLAELQSRARRYGVDVTLPLSIDKFRQAMQTYYSNAGNRRGPNPTDASSNTAAAAPASRVLTSGSGAASATPSSSSSTGQTTTWSSSSSSYGSSGGASSGSAIDSRVRNYAAALLRKYDKNHNGQLDREEWSELSGDWKSADLNGDGIITLDELTAWLMNRSRSRSQSSSSTSSSSSTATTTSSSAATTSSTAAPAVTATAASGTATTPATAGGPTNVLRRSYHFLTPSERLPSGLPEWFRRKDVNGDGQVTMAEFSDTWNEAVAAEFAKYDLNGDGVITAQECLEAQRKK
jgi:Ca2+-binding EF-hand superfamily protein